MNCIASLQASHFIITFLSDPRVVCDHRLLGDEEIAVFKHVIMRDPPRRQWPLLATAFFLWLKASAIAVYRH